MTMTSFINLESQRLRLRKFKDSDLKPFLGYRNDPEIARYQSWESMSEQETKDFIRLQKEWTTFAIDEWRQIAIELQETEQLIGDCAVKIFDDARQAEIGFTVAREHQKQGYAYEAVSTLLDHLFCALELHRVIAIADCENASSISLLRKLGMRQEGHYIKSFCFNGEWSDEYLFAILRGEWVEKK
jgi:RimJ/RimL family protein N-acetyltransferase